MNAAAGHIYTIASYVDMTFGAVGAVKLISRFAFSRTAAKLMSHNLGRKGLSNAQLVQRSATKAEAAIGGTGRFAGTAKHTYANKLLGRYQRIYGDRGLRFNHYFNNNATLGPGNRGFLDVLDTRNNVIYDFKFGNALTSF